LQVAPSYTAQLREHDQNYNTLNIGGESCESINIVTSSFNQAQSQPSHANTFQHTKSPSKKPPKGKTERYEDRPLQMAPQPAKKQVNNQPKA